MENNGFEDEVKAALKALIMSQPNLILRLNFLREIECESKTLVRHYTDHLEAYEGDEVFLTDEFPLPETVEEDIIWTQEQFSERFARWFAGLAGLKKRMQFDHHNCDHNKSN